MTFRKQATSEFYAHDHLAGHTHAWRRAHAANSLVQVIENEGLAHCIRITRACCGGMHRASQIAMQDCTQAGQSPWTPHLLHLSQLAMAQPWQRTSSVSHSAQAHDNLSCVCAPSLHLSCLIHVQLHRRPILTKCLLPFATQTCTTAPHMHMPANFGQSRLCAIVS